MRAYGKKANGCDGGVDDGGGAGVGAYCCARWAGAGVFGAVVDSGRRRWDERGWVVCAEWDGGAAGCGDGERGIVCAERWVLECRERGDQRGWSRGTAFLAGCTGVMGTVWGRPLARGLPHFLRSGGMCDDLIGGSGDGAGEDGGGGARVVGGVRGHDLEAEAGGATGDGGEFDEVGEEAVVGKVG